MNERRWFWIVMGAAALLRVIYMLDYRAHGVYWDSMLLDAQIYDEWAQRIAGGDWLGGSDVFTLPPLYPYFLGVIYTLAGRSIPLIYILQAVMGLCNVALVWSIGRKVFPGRTPLIAAGMSVLYGSFMFMETKLLATTLALTLGLSLMRLLLSARERQSDVLWGVCGLLLGVTALARPETLLFGPLAAWWIWRVAANKAIAVALFAVCVALGVVPCAARNFAVSGDWSLSNLISSQAGITFYQSNNDRAGGLYVYLAREGFSGSPAVQAEEERSIAEKELKLPAGSMQRSEVTRYWMVRGFDWILSHPGRYLLLELQKLWRFAGSYEYSTEYIIYVERELVRSLWLAPLPFAVIAILAAAGMLAQRRRGFNDAALLLVLFVAANLAAVLLFYVSSRYRMPSAPYLILFAASGASLILDRLRSPLASDRTGGWVALAAVVIIAVPLHALKDDSHLIQEANAHYNMGNAHYNKKRHEAAVAEYERAVAGDRSNWRAWFNRGNALRTLGRNQEAIDSFREVLRRNKEMTAARRQIQELGGQP